MRTRLLYLSILLSCQGAIAEDSLPTRTEVIEAMEEATRFFVTRLSQEGGYASEWTLDPFSGYTEHGTGKTVFSIQPHGTTTVGLAMLRAYQATGEKVFLTGANETGLALNRSQLSSGGWSSDFDFDPEFAKRYHRRQDVENDDTDPGKRRRLSTLDDNKTQSALLLLLELASIPENEGNEKIQQAFRFGMDSLIAAQAPDGSWPQQFDEAAAPDSPILEASFPAEWAREYPKLKYYRYATLNDGNLFHVMKLLLRAHELTHEDRFLDSAKRLGKFLLRAQLPEPQRAWAQQYNEKMEPAWARKFEPPAISSIESYGAVEALFELWIATGEERFRETIPEALDWLEKSQLKDGRWARFYELKTNRPLYCEAETYLVTYDDSNTPTHYGFKVASSLGRKVTRTREALGKDRETHLRQRKPPSSPEAFKSVARSLRGKVRDALAKQHKDGYWSHDDRVDAREFVRHMTVMADYAEAIGKASP